MKVVLFCGGLGTRLREYSESIPKPMVEIGYRPNVPEQTGIRRGPPAPPGDATNRCSADGANVLASLRMRIPAG